MRTNERTFNGEINYFNNRVGSDTYPYEVIEKKSERKYIVREMSWKHGYCSEENGTPYTDPDGEIKTITLRKDGRFYEVGTSYCPFIPTNKPHGYFDPTF